MDEKFQDRIDNYLLNRMDDAEKAKFLREVEQDERKKEQLEFTQKVKDRIRSREEKLQALAQFQKQYEEERKTAAYRATGIECATSCSPVSRVTTTEFVQPKKRIWLWISGVAAVLVVGFFAIKPVFENGSFTDHVRGPIDHDGENVFCSAPTDSTDSDTINVKIDTLTTHNETPNE